MGVNARVSSNASDQPDHYLKVSMFWLPGLFSSNTTTVVVSFYRAAAQTKNIVHLIAIIALKSDE